MLIGIASAETPNWPKMDWVEQAIVNLGHDVVRSRTAAELPDLLASCDLVILGHKSLAGRWPNIKKAIANRSCPVVYWWFDLISLEPGVPIVEQAYFKQWNTLLKESDVVLVKEAGMIDEYRHEGVNAFYMDQGCPSNMPEISDQVKLWDLLVWGQSSKEYRHRVRDVSAVVDEGFDVAWIDGSIAGAESFEKTEPFKLYERAERANTVLSCGRRNDVDGYWSDQFWMAMGMGCCVIRRSSPSLPENAPYIKYHTSNELCDAVRWSKSNTFQASQIGKMARKWVMENHTIEHRVEEVIKLVPIAAERVINESRVEKLSFA